MKKSVFRALVCVSALFTFHFSLFTCVQAQDFTALSPSGHTLCYNIVNGEAQVTSENPSPGLGSRAYANSTGAPWGALYMNGLRDGDFVFNGAARDTLISWIGNGSAVTIPEGVVGVDSAVVVK